MPPGHAEVTPLCSATHFQGAESEMNKIGKENGYQTPDIVFVDCAINMCDTKPLVRLSKILTKISF